MARLGSLDLAESLATMPFLTTRVFPVFQRPLILDPWPPFTSRFPSPSLNGVLLDQLIDQQAEATQTQRA